MPASFQRSRAIFASDDSSWRPRSFYAHRRQIQRALPVAAAAFCTLLLLILFRLGLFSSDQPPPLIVDPTPPHDDGSSRSTFYLWETASSFKPVTLDPKGKSAKDLCATFPRHILDTIQPVLKLGHADLGKPALDAQMKSVSACLDNVLVFSDLDDELPSGHFAHDVLSDLPASYRDHTRPADMEELWRWEHANRKHEKPILYRDLFEFHHPGQPSTRADWDNMWGPITIEGPPKTATFEECGAACQEHSACFQYNWHGDKCYLVHSIRLGHARDAEKETDKHKGGSFQSGWLSERIAVWRQQQRCEVVQWVRPSLTRIY
ncbi:hypothetical protein HYQ45_002542 [Verticillium longisporum]|uniref:Apple domain-containing protein n=1 Tax=Verticillium longisporum TaxID=100787 RepID=A0A8I2ZZF8_VERLO|nr:hypothetical protein HYQ45_002542 [Verticillium longisporum]